jgi:drug/metabolite transporter (DMT)-like permease
MPIGLALGLLATLAWGLVDVTAAIATRRVGSLRALVGTQLVSLVVLLGLAILRPDLLGEELAEGMLAGLPLGFLAAACYVAYFTALRLGPLSIVSPVIVAYGGFTVVLAVTFRGEQLTTAQAAGAVIATLGVVLAGITFEGTGRRLPRLVGPGVVAAVVTLVGFAVLTVLLATPIRDHGWLPVVIGSRIGNNLAVVGLLVVALWAGSRWFAPLLDPNGTWTRHVALLVVAGGLCDIAGFVAYSIGLQVAPVWLVGLASSFGPVLAVGYAVWRLGERPHATQWAGLALIAAGVAVLALVG